MEEDNSDTPRATRARTRRMSALESDRPLTPQVDLIAERNAAASPRVMRRTRVNSSTIDLRTPIRATRSVLARGETPEPSTPTLSLSAAKRATRTPAKSVRKPFTLQENLKEEEAEPKNASIEVAVESATPARRGEAAKISTPTSDDRRVTRSMSKTPPTAGRSANNTPINVANSPKAKPKETQQKTVATKIVDVQNIQSDEKAEETISKFQVKQEPVEEAEAGMASVSMSMVAKTSKVKVNVKDILLDLKSPKATKDMNKTNSQDEKHNGMEKEKEELMPSTQVTEVLLDDLDVALICDAVVIDDVRLPDLTPKLKSRVVEQKGSETRKAVGFNSENQVEEENAKTKYPKTPARISNSTVKKESLLKDKSETPLKSLQKGRKSSTPLAKPEVPTQDQETAAFEEANKEPPAQIDVIPPYSALEDDNNNNNNKATEVEITKDKLTLRLASDDEDDEADSSSSRHNEGEYEDAEEDEDDRSVCEFFDTEAEVIENYESGDSMDSAERREIGENEIPYDGESVGSQDTLDEHSEDEGSADEKMSFIVSDSDGDNGDGSSIASLCFSSAEEDAVEDKQPKKFRRIVAVNDSSEDEKSIDTVEKENKIKNDENTREKPIEKLVKKDEEIAELPEKPLKPTESEKAAQLDQSIAINKTASSVGHSDVEAMEIDEVLSSSDDENAGNKSKLNNKSIYEVTDSCDDDDDDVESSDKTEAKDTVDDFVNKSPETSAKCEIEPASPLNGKLAIEDTGEMPSSSSKQSEQSLTETATASESSTLQDKQKHGEDEALLAELASCDLSHLQKMFNPLQKSRRQTLYSKDTPTPAKEPKLKRRSVQLNSDVQPSQSFIETLAEEQRRLSKRKRMSKSFCGAADNLDLSVVEEVQRKKSKKSCDNFEAVKVEEQTADQLEKVLTANDQLEVELPLEIELPAAQKEEVMSLVHMEKELHVAPKDEEMPVAQEKELQPVANNVEKELPVAQKDEEIPVAQKDEKLPVAQKDEELPVAQKKKEFLPIANNVEKVLPADKIEVELPADKVEVELPAAQNEDAGTEEKNTPIVCVGELSAAKLEQQLPGTAVAAPNESKKRRSFYLEYCDSILLAANEAKLQQKKQQRLAAGNQQVKRVRPARVITNPLPNTPIAIPRASPERERSTKIKKNVKRLQDTKQAVKQAVNHAVQLLVPDAAAKKQPQSLARKLSPQPEINGKKAKQTKANKKKPKELVEQVTPGNSSDEEERFKTKAGWVVVTKEQQEIVNTNSGPMIVEPCTPKLKHFKVEHVTPKYMGFQEQQLHHKKKAKDKRNAATEAAMRFKMKMFGRDK